MLGIAACAVIAFPSSGIAVPIDTDPFHQLPIAFTPAEMSDLNAGKTIVRLVETKDSSIKEGIAVALVALSPERLFAVVTDNAHFAEFMPHVRSSTVASGAGGAIENHQELSLPFPIADRNYTIRIVNTAGPPVWISAWTYVAGSGNVSETRGAWMIVAVSTDPLASRSVLFYRVYTDPGGVIPGWAFNVATRKTLPDLVAAVVKRASGS